MCRSDPNVKRVDVMTVMKEKAVDIISRMSEDKVYHVLQ